MAFPDEATFSVRPGQISLREAFIRVQDRNNSKHFSYSPNANLNLGRREQPDLHHFQKIALAEPKVRRAAFRTRLFWG
jgi:hypothetical protein